MGCIASRSQTHFPRHTSAKIGSGAIALKSSCCRLYDKRATKDRMSMVLLSTYWLHEERRKGAGRTH